MSQTPEAFTELLARARQGDNSAMTELIQQYEPEIRRVAHNRLGPALRPFGESMDFAGAVHGTLIATRRQNNFPTTKRGELPARGVTLVIRKLSRHWHDIQREEQVLRLVTLLRSRTVVEDDPAAAVERLDRVQNLLKQVDDRDRRLLELHLEDRSTKEIATQLNLKENVVRVLRSRLFQKLRAQGVDPMGPN